MDKLFSLRLHFFEFYYSRNRIFNYFAYSRSFQYDKGQFTDLQFEKFKISYKVAKKRHSLRQIALLRFRYLFVNYKNLHFYDTKFPNLRFDRLFFIKKFIIFMRRFYYPSDNSTLASKVMNSFPFNKLLDWFFYPLFLSLKKLFGVYESTPYVPEKLKFFFNVTSLVPLRLRSVYKFLYSSVYLSTLNKWFFYKKSTPIQRLVFDYNRRTFDKALRRANRFYIPKVPLRKLPKIKKKKLLGKKYIKVRLNLKARRTYTNLMRSQKKHSYNSILATSQLNKLLGVYSRVTENKDTELRESIFDLLRKTRRKGDKRGPLSRAWDDKLEFKAFKERRSKRASRRRLFAGRVRLTSRYKKIKKYSKNKFLRPTLGLRPVNNKLHSDLVSLNAICNFNYLLTEKKILPNLQNYFESAQLFDMDASNNSSYNLSLSSAPDFFWDEWDADFLNQQNGLLSTEDMVEDDDFYGEERLMSKDLAFDYDLSPRLSSLKGTEIHRPSSFFKNRRLAKMLDSYKYDAALRTSKPAFNRPFTYLIYFDYNGDFVNPSLETIDNVVEPDFEGVPVEDKFFPVLGVKGSERITDIPVGDGPINFDVGDDEDWDRSYDDAYDSTLLYDWYTLQRVNSKFSNRPPANRFSKYVPQHNEDYNWAETDPFSYAPSVLSCSKVENYFFREFFEIEGENFLEDLRRYRTYKISVNENDEEYSPFKDFQSFSKAFENTLTKFKFNFSHKTPISPTLASIDKNSTKSILINSEFQAKTLGRSYYYSERGLNRQFNLETANQKRPLIDSAASSDHSFLFRPLQNFYAFSFLASLSVVIAIVLSLFIAHPNFSFFFAMRNSSPFTYWDPSTYEPEILTRRRNLEQINYPILNYVTYRISRPFFGFIADYFPDEVNEFFSGEDTPGDEYAKWAKKNKAGQQKYRSRLRRIASRNDPPDEVPDVKAIRTQAATAFLEKIDQANAEIEASLPPMIEAREYELSKKELKEVLSYDEAREIGLLRALPPPTDLRYQAAYKFLREHVDQLGVIDWISYDYFNLYLIELEEWFEEENKRRAEAKEELLVWDIPDFEWDHMVNWFDVQTTAIPLEEGTETQVEQTDEFRRAPNKQRRKKPRLWRGTEYLDDFNEFVTHGEHPLVFKEPLKNQYSSIPREVERSKKLELLSQKTPKSPFDYRSELLRRRPRFDPERNSALDSWFTKNLNRNKNVRKYFDGLSHRASFEYLLNSNSGSYGLANQYSRRDLYYTSQVEKRDAQYLIRRTGSSDFDWVRDSNFLRPYWIYDIWYNTIETAHMVSSARPSLSSMSWFLRVGAELLGRPDHLASKVSTMDMQVRDFETTFVPPFRYFEKKKIKYFDGTYLYWGRPRHNKVAELSAAHDDWVPFIWHMETDRDSILLDQVRIYQAPYNLGFRGTLAGHLYWEPDYEETSYLNLAQENRFHQQYPLEYAYTAVPGYEPLLAKLELDKGGDLYTFPEKDKFGRYWDEQPKKPLLVKEALKPSTNILFEEYRDPIIKEVWLPVFDRKTGEEVSFLKSGRDVRRSSLGSRRHDNFYTLFYQKYAAITTVDPISMRAQLPPVEYPVDKGSEIYAHNARRSKYDYIPILGIDPYKFNDFANVGYNPLFKLFRIPTGPINNDILTLSDKNDSSQLYRWLVLLNHRTNLYDYSVGLTTTYEDHFFHKSKAKSLHVNRVFFHPATQVDMTLVFNIPSLWENYYNSRWLKNLPSFFRLTTSPDENYHVSHYLGYNGLYFFERLFIDVLKNIVNKLFDFISFWRLLFIVVGLIYIFNKPYLYLKHMYAKTRIFSFTMNQTEVSRNSLYLSNRRYCPGSTSSARSYNLKVFNMFVFKLPLKKFKRLNNFSNLSYKYQFPEFYNEGARNFDNKNFLQRPKSLETRVIDLSRKSCSSFNFYKTPIIKTTIGINSLTRFGAYSYSFLWSMPPIKKIKTRWKKKRSRFFHKVSRNFMKKVSYRKYIQKQYLKPTQNIFFVKQSLPYVIDPVTNLTSLVSYPEINTEKQRLATDFYFLCEDEDMEDREILNDKVTQAAINESDDWNEDRLWYEDNEANFSNENELNEFRARRELWSKLRGLDRRSAVLLKKYKTLDPLFLEIYTKQVNMKLYASNNLVISLLTDSTISESSLLNIALKDLNANYKQSAMLDDSKDTGPIVELEDDDFGDYDVDNFDSKEEDFTDSLQLVLDMENVEDDFEAVFMDLVYSVTPENSLVEVTLSSLLLDKTFNNVAISPTIANDNFLIRSELVNYKMWRTHRLDSYVLAVPTQDVTIDDISISKIHFSINSAGLPIQYSALFLVPYSLPRFLVRLDKVSIERYRVKNTLRFSEANADIYDNGYVGHKFPRAFRNSMWEPRRSRGRMATRPLKKYFAKSDLIKPTKMELQPFLRDNKLNSALDDGQYNYESFENSNRILVQQRLDPYSGEFMYRNIVSLFAEDLNSTIKTFVNNDLNENVQSYHVENNEDADQVFPSTDFYRWRFLSPPYLSVLSSRPKEFNTTQILPFIDYGRYETYLVAENFNYKNFTESLTCYRFNSPEALDSDLISEWLSHFLTDLNDPWEIQKIVDLLFNELHPEEENSFMEEEMFDDEDEDDFEDDFFTQQSHYKIDNESEFSPVFKFFMRFLFRDINMNPSLNLETIRQDTLSSRAVSEAVTLFTDHLDRHKLSGLSAFPAITDIDDEDEDLKMEKSNDNFLLKLEKLRIAKRDTESLSLNTDMEDVMIPTLRSNIMRTFYEGNETVFTDTIEKFLGRISPEILERYVSELKAVRHDLISKNVVDSPFLNFTDINVVNSKDLFIYVFAIKSPYVMNLFYSNSWRPMANIESNAQPEGIMDELDLLEDIHMMMTDDTKDYYDDVIIQSFAKIFVDPDSYDSSQQDLLSLAYDKLLVESPALRFVVLSSLYFNEFEAEYTTCS